MHVLGHYGKENAAAIFELFLECMPEYPLDKPDNEGNTGKVNVICFVFSVHQVQHVQYCFMTDVLLQFCFLPT